MDVANAREDCMSGCRSFGNNCQRLSQSRKISVGVLPTPIISSQTKSVKETAIAENRINDNGNCAKDNKGSSPLMRKEVTISPKDVSPWVSTRAFNTKVSSVAVHTPSFTSMKHLRPKLSKKVSVAHSVKYFGDRKFDVKSNEGEQKCHGDPGNENNVEHVENHEFTIEPGALQEKELGGDKQSKTEIEGCGTLKMKLWEILGNVSSPSKQCPGSQSVEFKQSQERDIMGSPVVKANQKSNTIESDSQKPDHTIKRPLVRSSTRKNASTRKHNKEIEAKNSTLHRRECVEKDIFSFGGEPSGRLSDTANDAFMRYQRKNKTEKGGFGSEKLHGNVHENDKKRQQSEDKTRSVSSAEKIHTEMDKVHTSNDGLVCYKRKNKSAKQVFGPEKLQGSTFDIYIKKRRQLEDKTRSVSSAEKLNTDREKVHLANITTNKRSDVFTGRRIIGSKNKNETKTKSVSTAEKSSIQKNKAPNAKSTRNRRNDDFSESKTGSKKTNVCEVPLNQQIELKSDVEIPIVKDQQEDIANSLLKNRMDSVQDLSSPAKSPVNTFAVLAETKKGHRNNLSSNDNLAATDGIQRFKSLLNLKTSEYKLNAQDGEGELKYCPSTKIDFTMEDNKGKRLSKSSSGTSDSESSEDEANMKETKKENLQDQRPVDNTVATDCVRTFKSLMNSKSSECKSNVQDVGEGLDDCPLTIEEDRVKGLSDSATDTTDSESSEDDTNIKGGREPEVLSTGIYVAEKFLCGANKRSRNERSVQMTECTPISGSSREIEINEHQTYLEQYQEGGLAGAVALLATALNHIKMKLKSMSSNRTAEILRASAEEICSQLQNAESQIKTDMGKLTSLSKLKRKRMETKFQEKQDQLLGIFKKFKEEVDQHLNYGRIFEELEEYEVELKGSIEKQREDHMKLIAQVEQAIKGQIDETESRIVAIEDTAKEKMLQMKLVVAECVKTCSGWLG